MQSSFLTNRKTTRIKETCILRNKRRWGEREMIGKEKNYELQCMGCFSSYFVTSWELWWRTLFVPTEMFHLAPRLIGWSNIPRECAPRPPRTHAFVIELENNDNNRAPFATPPSPGWRVLVLSHYSTYARRLAARHDASTKRRPT